MFKKNNLKNQCFRLTKIRSNRIPLDNNLTVRSSSIYSIKNTTIVARICYNIIPIRCNDRIWCGGTGQSVIYRIGVIPRIFETDPTIWRNKEAIMLNTIKSKVKREFNPNRCFIIKTRCKNLIT